MSFVRVHLTSLIWAAVGLASVGIAISGAARTSVKDELKARIGIARDIDALKANPKSEKWIAAERQRAAALRDELQKATKCVQDINRRKPLVAGLFPEPERPSAGFAFVEAYTSAAADLSTLLRAGGLPTLDDIEEVRAQDRPKDDDAARLACVLQARRIRCYVAPETFCVSPVSEATSAPTPGQLWFAQVALWVQQDAVAAITKLNDDAAAQVRAGPACVEHMPVKRIDAVRVFGYALRDGLLRFSECTATDGFEPSFTGETCNEHFDVVRYALAVVADQRDVLRLIDEIGKQNLCRCVGARFSAIDATDERQGYLYGTEPAVRVHLEFEAYFARAVYVPLMPREIRALLGAED